MQKKHEASNLTSKATYKSAHFMKWIENEQRIAQFVKWALRIYTSYEEKNMRRPAT
jgi:hypothetical protein